MFKFLVLCGILGETHAFVGVARGPGAFLPSLSALRKGVNSQLPVRFGLEHEAAGNESALRTIARRELGASWAFAASDQRSEDARSPLRTST